MQAATRTNGLGHGIDVLEPLHRGVSDPFRRRPQKVPVVERTALELIWPMAFATGPSQIDWL